MLNISLFNIICEIEMMLEKCDFLKHHLYFTNNVKMS